MKILCFSDSHGTAAYMRTALSMHPDCELVIFLGDGLDDCEPLIEKDKTRKWLLVRGNCDRSLVCAGELVKKTDFITVLGKKILFTHGDLYSAKAGDDGIVSLAEETSADVVLYGHTHRRRESFIRRGNREFYLFNPGSIGEVYPESASFGIITLTEDTVLFSHGSVRSRIF